MVGGLGDIGVHTRAALALRASFPLTGLHNHALLQKGHILLLHLRPQMTNTMAFPPCESLSLLGLCCCYRLLGQTTPSSWASSPHYASHIIYAPTMTKKNPSETLGPFLAVSGTQRVKGSFETGRSSSPTNFCLQNVVC